MEYDFEERNQPFNQSAEYEMIKNIATRPGMFVGDNRLDYIEIYLNGFYAYKKSILKDKLHLPIDYELEKWLFFKESVIIAHAATLNGWSLMMRCYGYEKKACEQFRVFLEETAFIHYNKSNELTVAQQIFEIYSYFHWNKEIDKDFYPLIQEIRNMIGKSKYSYEKIVSFVSKIISEPHDDLWIYLHYENYFQQVRFLYHTESKGWIDNTDLVSCKKYYQNLIILHAYVTLVQKEKHSNHVITIHCKNNKIFVDTMEIVDYWNEVFNHGADKSMRNENPLNYLFSKWAGNIVCPEN